MPMTNFPLEWSLSQDYLKRLNEKEKMLTEHVLASTLEPREYAETVGHIRALREAKDIWQELLKQYFPEYRK